MQAGIALGSNIEPRLLHLQAAAQKVLSLHKGSKEALQSKIYETSPVDCPQGSESFLNAVMEIDSNLIPEDLLKHLKAIEIELGRSEQHARNAPRTVDLDLLYCDNFTLQTAEFSLPHPRLAERLFVLKPLADIQSDLLLPNYRNTIKSLLESYSGDEKIHHIQNVLF